MFDVHPHGSGDGKGAFGHSISKFFSFNDIFRDKDTATHIDESRPHEAPHDDGSASHLWDKDKMFHSDFYFDFHKLHNLIKHKFCKDKKDDGKMENPAIDIEKATNGADADTPPGPIIEVGGTATFTYEVTNTGDVPLANVVVTDDNGTPDDPTDDFNPMFTGGDLNDNDLLDLEETWTYEAERVDVPEGQYTNTATVSGTSPRGTEVTDEDPSNHLGQVSEPDNFPTIPKAISNVVLYTSNVDTNCDTNQDGVYTVKIDDFSAQPDVFDLDLVFDDIVAFLEANDDPCFSADELLGVAIKSGVDAFDAFDGQEGVFSQPNNNDTAFFALDGDPNPDALPNNLSEPVTANEIDNDQFTYTDVVEFIA